MTPESLAELLAELGDDFIAAETDGETNEQIADAIVELILKRERIRRGVIDSNEETIVDHETITRLGSWDSSNPEFAVLEKVFRQLAQGNGGDAVAYLKRSIELRAEKVSQKQSQTASAPRPGRRSSVLIAIDEIVRSNPNIKEHDAVKQLRKHQLIWEVDDDWITPKDESPKIARSSLRTHLTNARNKYRK